ncbi:outer membrane lipoprotein-sorting protein [Halostella salina]|uniref:outer membrane lipoprotein-sorting protein n=1 Tax=Halostella salina TaxID=1547897 RepID=UPI000EF7898F|nr:DUF4367 domain-containing protein [Halostella salina]
MVPNSLRSSLPALLLVGMIALSGCLGAVAPGDSATETETDDPTTERPDEQAATATETAESDDETTEPPTDEELTESFRERLSGLDSITMTQEMTYVIDGNETTTETRTWARFDTGESRTKTLSPEAASGDVTIINESAMQRYDESESTVTVYDRSGTSQGTLGTTFGGLENASLQYEATEQVDGERTYRVSITPTNTVGTDVEVTGWIDAETYFPVRYESAAQTGEYNVSTTVEYENVTLNPDLPDSTFTFEDLPDDVTFETYETPDTETYNSREALTAASNLSVPDPDVPAGYEFESGMTVTGNTEQVSITYTNGTDRFTVTKIAATYDTNGENVTVGDQQGAYDELGSTAMVSWTCDGRTYSVTGPFDEDGLVEIAESMACH